MSPIGESVLDFRVLPSDLDVYGHMNNGRYLTLMDLGRMDMLYRTGLIHIAKKRRWNPLVASSLVRYKKSLSLFQPYRLHTRIVCWDEKWFFIEQKFKINGHDIAVGLIKGLFYGHKGKVPTETVIAALGHQMSSPPMPDSIKMWLETESIMNDHKKSN